MSDKLEFLDDEEGEEFKSETSEESTEDFEPEPASEAVESDDEEPEDPSAEIIQLEDLDDATVSQHRKGYIKYINEIFYDKLKDLKKESSLKIYQVLVQNYLALDTPYRGLLVYHGLGTGSRRFKWSNENQYSFTGIIRRKLYR